MEEAGGKVGTTLSFPLFWGGWGMNRNKKTEQKMKK
jgi:hypothetical protein